MGTDADILIVGAGIAGAATAYHLRRRGVDRVLLIEQEATAGVHSSGRNAAIIRTASVEPSLFDILEEGAAFLRTGELAAYDPCGVMMLGEGDEDVRKYFSRASGVGAWHADQGTLDVAALLAAYLSGADVRYSTRVQRWTQRDECVEVTTDRGVLTCDVLVNAAGPWAGAFGDLPLTPMNRHLFTTPPLDWVRPEWPCVLDQPRGLYFRPESGGLLLCCFDETAAEPGDYREDPAVLERLAERVAATQPDFGEISIRSSWVGQRTFTPDREFVIGFDPRHERLFHVAGLGGHGITSSHAVGKLAAERLLSGPHVESGPFSPGRLVRQNSIEK